MKSLPLEHHQQTPLVQTKAVMVLLSQRLGVRIWPRFFFLAPKYWQTMGFSSAASAVHTMNKEQASIHTILSSKDPNHFERHSQGNNTIATNNAYSRFFENKQ